jgi:FtsZ-binding cell division protein ZapB
MDSSLLSSVLSLFSFSAIVVGGIVGIRTLARYKSIEAANDAAMGWKTLAESLKIEKERLEADVRVLTDKVHALELEISGLKARPDLAKVVEEMAAQRKEFTKGFERVISHLEVLTERVGGKF